METSYLELVVHSRSAKAVEADPFAKANKMIKGRIVKLMEGAIEEAEHKGWCVMNAKVGATCSCPPMDRPRRRKQQQLRHCMLRSISSRREGRCSVCILD